MCERLKLKGAMETKYQIHYKRVARGGKTGTLGFTGPKLIEEIRRRGIAEVTLIRHFNGEQLDGGEMLSLWQEVVRVRTDPKV